MNVVGKRERVTQDRVIALFRDELGYRYLGDWTDRDGNSNIEEDLLSAWLTKSGYTPAQISVALHKLRTEADNHSRTLYGNNQAVYNLLRYGVPVKIEAGKVTETVHLINWQEPEKNDFAIAEEVTLKGNHERRPDIVLYVNGIAVSVLELKNSRVSIGDGIRQNLSNQQPEFNAWFFSTVQFIFAGNDSEGLQYGAIGTPEKYFMKWKEDEADDSRFKLDKYLLKMCAKQRLIELGMTRQQIEQLEASGEANSRVHLCAPISGTVIKKYATEGQYVKEGQAIYELADLSTVWLMLELFPEDAAAIRYGQKVEAEVQSLPGRKFTGRVAFIDPTVDPTKRTVGVRVVIPNDDGLLRVGDYAKATIHAPLADGESLVVPRNAVLLAGSDSVLYVETEPGRFEIRNVVLGARSGDQIVVLKGLQEGEQVAVSGNFLIDSQMQLAGNPSLIDPTKAEPLLEIEFEEGDLPPIGTPQMVAAPQLNSPTLVEQVDEQTTVTNELSPEDHRLAERQKVCPVTDLSLGSMGGPIKVMVEGRPVFICCEGCRARLLAEPAKYLAKLEKEAVR
ncbi:MAG: efflux RND transporter periplasmic adaptor subunit [Planctomycetes bacterium]|nr:efflux RND transporter periplasmic adaptor subunit [Planctomycetota bacterium]